MNILVLRGTSGSYNLSLYKKSRCPSQTRTTIRHPSTSDATVGVDRITQVRVADYPPRLMGKTEERTGSASSYSTPSPSSSGSSCSATYPMDRLSLSQHSPVGTAAGGSLNPDSLANKRRKQGQASTSSTPSGAGAGWGVPSQGASGSKKPYPQGSSMQPPSSMDAAHTPTNLPPKPYPAGNPYLGSKQKQARIPESAMPFVSTLYYSQNLSLILCLLPAPHFGRPRWKPRTSCRQIRQDPR